MKHLKLFLSLIAASVVLVGCGSQIAGTATAVDTGAPSSTGGSVTSGQLTTMVMPPTSESSTGADNTNVTNVDGYCNGELTTPGPCPATTDSTVLSSSVIPTPESQSPTPTPTTPTQTSTAVTNPEINFSVKAMLNAAPVLFPAGSKVLPAKADEGLNVDLPGPGDVLLQAFGESTTTESARSVFNDFTASGQFYGTHQITRVGRTPGTIVVTYPGGQGTYTDAELVNGTTSHYDFYDAYIADKTAATLDAVVVVVSKTHGTIIFVVHGDPGDYTNVQNGIFLSVFGLMGTLDNREVG